MTKTWSAVMTFAQIVLFECAGQCFLVVAASRKRKAKDWEENDFYDSDDDTFLDRTGLIEEKRQQRMKRLGKLNDKAETYDSLVRFNTVGIVHFSQCDCNAFVGFTRPKSYH